MLTISVILTDRLYWLMFAWELAQTFQRCFFPVAHEYSGSNQNLCNKTCFTNHDPAGHWTNVL